MEIPIIVEGRGIFFLGVVFINVRLLSQKWCDYTYLVLESNSLINVIIHKFYSCN